MQGSGFGPSSFDVVDAGLQFLSASNFSANYADDTYLLVPASARSTVSSELVNISNWATSNNLRFNADKSKELILHKRTRIKILGITLTGDFSVAVAAVPITKVLELRARSLYALRILKSHEIPPAALHEVARATRPWVGICTLLQHGGALRLPLFASALSVSSQLRRPTVRMGYLPQSNQNLSL